MGNLKPRFQSPGKTPQTTPRPAPARSHRVPATALALIASAATLLGGCASQFDEINIDLAFAQADGQPITSGTVTLTPYDRRIVPVNPLTLSGATDYFNRPEITPRGPYPVDAAGISPIQSPEGLAFTVSLYLNRPTSTGLDLLSWYVAPSGTTDKATTYLITPVSLGAGASPAASSTASPGASLAASHAARPEASYKTTTGNTLSQTPPTTLKSGQVPNPQPTAIFLTATPSR